MFLLTIVNSKNSQMNEISYSNTLVLDIRKAMAWQKKTLPLQNILKKCYEENTVHEFTNRILEYNITPVASMRMSPTVFFGRQIRSRNPVVDKNLLRNNLDESDIQKRIDYKKKYQKFYYDRCSKPLKKLNVGDSVMFKKNSKQWFYGKIVRNINDRSCLLTDNIGNFYRRNRKFIINADSSNNLDDIIEDVDEIINKFRNQSNQTCSTTELDKISEQNVESEIINNQSDNNSAYESALDASVSDDSLNEGFGGFEDDINLQKALVVPDSNYSTRSGRMIKMPSHLKNY